MITPELLFNLEKKYGGVVKSLMRKKSPLDLRPKKVGQSLLVGGDRMAGGGSYRTAYANHLPEAPEVLVELGIFKGTGLAIWCDVFPDTQVIGLDIDTDYFDQKEWEAKGGFQQNAPEVYVFDKFLDNTEFYKKFPPIDVMIDDSAHDIVGILFAFENVLPFLAPQFVYFIEDNISAVHSLKERHPSLGVELAGGIIVIKPNLI